MLRKCCAVCAVLALAFTASADIVVNFNPQVSTIGVGDVVTVQVVADIPANEAVVGWGWDINIVTPGIVNLVSKTVADPPWNEVPDNDNDGLAALLPPPGTGLFGNVLLATLQFQGIALGSTQITLSTTPGDLTEGFAIDPALGGGFAPATFVAGTINVPEPASLMLLAVAGLLLRRR